jgi:enoyl-CoA hydratase
MPFDTLMVTIAERVATITINRPDKRNALSAAVRRDILEALDELRGEEEVRVVIFTGAGDKAFIAGADIGEFAERTALEQRAVMEGRRIFDEIAAFPKPTIAMINGFALGGGCELAMACDMRIAARSAKLGQPEIRLGLIPGGGGTQRLPRLVGSGRALKLILSGEIIDAEEAHRIGLVDEIVDDDQLRAHTTGFARAMAAHSPVALLWPRPPCAPPSRRRWLRAWPRSVNSSSRRSAVTIAARALPHSWKNAHPSSPGARRPS